MVLLSTLGLLKGEKSRTINEIRDSRSINYKGYVKNEFPYRILSSLYIFFLVVVMGIIAYKKTVVTYRAPFPTGEEKSNITLWMTVSLAITDSSLNGVGGELKKYIESSFNDMQQPLPVRIEGRVNNVEQRSLSSLSRDNSPSSSLDISIALVPSKEWTHFSATTVLLTKGKWALIQISEDEELSKVLARVHHLIFYVLIDIPHLELIVKRDRRERMEPWHIATMSPEHQKRLTWDCNALSSSYSIRVIHVHSSCSSVPCLPSSINPTLIPSLNRLSALLKDITTLNIMSEHIFDLDLDPFVEEDVQGRFTISQHNIHLLLKEMDSLVSPTQSIVPQLKIVIVDSERKMVMADGEGEDVSGISVSEWGGVIVNDERITSNVIASLRMLLGIDSHLPSSFKREASPISQWELTRLSIRSIIDSSLRTKHSIRALRSLINDIENLVFSDDLSHLISSSISYLSSSLSTPEMPSLSQLKIAVINAENALMDSSLLSLLYFPTEQKFGIFLPLLALYLAPALFLLPRIIYYLISRG